jgi:hypothetical protein
MTEAQKKIVAAFPAADRGELDGRETVVEEDFVIAGHKKHVNKQLAMRERKRIREGREDDSESDYNSDLENGDLLDSEEEDFQERKLLGEINPGHAFKSTHKQE